MTILEAVLYIVGYTWTIYLFGMVVGYRMGYLRRMREHAQSRGLS